jgi:hypothetical protein
VFIHTGRETAAIDGQILALDESELAQRVEETGEHTCWEGNK